MEGSLVKLLLKHFEEARAWSDIVHFINTIKSILLFWA